MLQLMHEHNLDQDEHAELIEQHRQQNIANRIDSLIALQP